MHPAPPSCGNIKSTAPSVPCGDLPWSQSLHLPRQSRAAACLHRPPRNLVHRKRCEHACCGHPPHRQLRAVAAECPQALPVLRARRRSLASARGPWATDWHAAQSFPRCSSPAFPRGPSGPAAHGQRIGLSAAIGLLCLVVAPPKT